MYTFTTTVDVEDYQVSELRNFYMASGKLAAIKRFREITGVRSLKTAKEAIEHMAEVGTWREKVARTKPVLVWKDACKQGLYRMRVAGVSFDIRPGRDVNMSSNALLETLALLREVEYGE